MFFKTLETSILNSMQSKFNKKVQSSKATLNSFLDVSNAQLSSEDMSTVLNVKFPLNNQEFNYMIIDANLGIKENLKNIFFLEFELGNSKDNLKSLREINNENVERELFFLLNGHIHGVPLFSSDLKFSVETRKFIKSIQFRLETYKKELLSMEKTKSLNLSGQKNSFFAKVLSNTNLGIEFVKPYL